MTSTPTHLRRSVLIRAITGHRGAPRAVDELDDALARRLGVLAIVTATAWAIALLVDDVLGLFGVADFLSPGRRRFADWFMILALLDSLGVIWMVRRRRYRGGRALRNMVVGYQIAVALGVSMLDALRPLTADQVPLGIPSVCLWLVLFPTLVPLDFTRALVGTLGSVLVATGTLWAADTLGYSEPGPQVYRWMLVASGLTALLGMLPHQIIARLRRQLSQAADLGAYRLLRRLGGGGMGDVWVAEHRMLARPAAIKLIKPEAIEAGGEAQARFAREARVTALLRSPHTVEVFDYGLTDEKTFYYAMELLEGFDLDDLVRLHGGQPVDRVLGWLLHACDSLAEAHTAGLVHRDIKPANLMVCPLGVENELVKVLDFGLARTTRASSGDPRLTQHNTLAGTPAFLPPEMAVGEEPDGRADLYALGCVAFWLLTGRVLFPATSSTAAVVAHLKDDPVAPSTLAPAVPPAVDALVLRCLAKDPSARFPDAAALAEALHAARAQLTERWSAEDARQWWAQHGPVRPDEAPPAEALATTAVKL